MSGFEDNYKKILLTCCIVATIAISTIALCNVKSAFFYKSKKYRYDMQSQKNFDGKPEDKTQDDGNAREARYSKYSKPEVQDAGGR